MLMRAGCSLLDGSPCCSTVELVVMGHQPLAMLMTPNVSHGSIFRWNRGAAATRAPTGLISPPPFTPLHMPPAGPRSLLYFHRFLFPALYSTMGEFVKRRDDLQSSAPASTSTLLRPPGAPPLPTHTSAATRLYIYSPPPQPFLPPTHVTSSLPETHNYFLQTPVLTYDSIFNYKRAKQAGTGGGGGNCDALMSLAAFFSLFFT